MGDFCSLPFVYSGRISPCLIEPLLSLFLFVSILGCYFYGRRHVRFSQQDDEEALLNSSIDRNLPQNSLPKRIGAAKWQLTLSRGMVVYTFFIAVIQALVIIGQSSWDDNSDDFYAISCALIAVSWYFYHSYFCMFCGSIVYLDYPLASIGAFALLIDIFLIFSRFQMILIPDPHDPNIMEKQLVLDLIIISIRFLLLSAFMVIGIRFKGQGYLALDNSDSGSNVSAFSNFFAKTSKLSQFVWPRGNLKLQVLVFLCVCLLIAARFINFYVPLQFKTLVDALLPDSNGKMSFPLLQVLLFALLKFIQGSTGLMDTIRSTLWIPVEQYTTRQVSCEVFKHLHSLSLRWHLNRKTGEVLRIMDRGTTAITSLLSYIFFNIVPVLVDITVAVIYFVLAFDITFGLIVLATMVLYLASTIWITEWRTKYRRTMIELDNKTNYKAVDALLNYETVKYYGNEDFELNNYKECVVNYQQADWFSQLTVKFLNSIQNIIIAVGLLVGSILCVQRIVDGKLGVGDFVLFITYLQQLYQPLNWFGTYYRMINQNFIDMEKMLALLNEGIEVRDVENAPDLNIQKGHVVFENVNFTYDPKKTDIVTLRNISFEIPAGKTVALCGPSGSGKSSLVKLLFRFYDISSGRILIDGQDISQVTQKSLRKSIGVVPQDTVLFNDTLMYNIRYGKIEAKDEDVIHSAEMAQIHDKILDFPEKYDTQVGERGLRLSGGEKQRIAIARTILKDPPIVLLDEATSALDSTTESRIQNALSKMTKERTTLVVAHRLSTIIHAHLILVVKNGEIVERGSHDELLQMKGIYHEMWYKQQQDD